MGAWSIEPLSGERDVDAMLAIEEASFSNPWSRDMYLSELRNPGVSYFFVARDHQGHVVGFCSFWRIHDELHINNLAVAPDMRRRGVASALLTRVLSEAETLGATRATLEVRRSNTAAQRLYERFGFRAAGIRRAYYSHPVEDALLLWRDRTGDLETARSVC